MKMKKYINNIAVIFAASLLGISCNDSFLDRNPTNDLIENDYWKTINQLEVYNNGTYNEASNGDNVIMNGFGSDPYSSNTTAVLWYDAQSDNFASKSANHQWATQIAAGKETVPNNPTRGGWIWSLLRRCNVLLNNYQQVNGKPSVKNMYAGEALFFRAWFYLDKVQQYGDVPYITKPLTTESDELTEPNNPRKDVMDSVLVDINKACDYLPTSWGKDKPGRVDKGTALALKSRICLYEGTYRKYHNLGDYEKYLVEAVKASSDLMALGKYSILNTKNPTKDYASLFTADNLEGNPEVIFYRKYVTGLLAHRLSGYIVQSGVGATKDFVEDFLCKESSSMALPVSLSKVYSDDNIEKELDNRDPRLTQIILDPRMSKDILYKKDQFTFPRVAGMTGWESSTGYHVIKYYDKDQDSKGYGNESSDAPLFRYAEVLLNLAEAKAELGTITQDDLDKTINVLRDRVAMPHLSLNPPMDPKYASEGISSLLVEIRRERRVELCFEQLRYTDLMRWKEGKKLAAPVLGMRFEPSYFKSDRYKGADPKRVILVEINGKHYIDVFAKTDWADRTFDENKHYLHPIPVNVLSKNSQLKQNPNW